MDFAANIFLWTSCFTTNVETFHAIKCSKKWLENRYIYIYIYIYIFYIYLLGLIDLYIFIRFGRSGLVYSSRWLYILQLYTAGNF